MDQNLTKFLKDLDREIGDSLSNMDSKIKGVGIAIRDHLFLPKSLGGTPVQTSHLRSNWVTSLDSKLEGVVGSKESVDTSVQEQAWEEFLGMDQLYLHNNIYFNNNVEYGPIVNAQQGFRELSIQNGEQWLSANR